jgi:GNAT superfamily N-acetyltransferase
MVRIGPLSPSMLPEASALLTESLPFDHIAVVIEEKLFADGRAAGAFEGDTLIGLVAVARRWIKLLAVAPAHRRRGVGSALLEEARRDAPSKLRVFDHPGNYLAPGVDVRYEAAHAFLRARGFRELRRVENIRAPLENNPLIDRTPSVAGYELRRAGDADRAPLLEMAARAFSPTWAQEIARAMDGPRRAVHVALQNGAPVAFAAADGNNRGLGWFGPAGTLPEHRGKRLGEALLLPTLRDVRGLPEGGVIAWIGPKEFYAKACGAVDDRTFVQYEEA